MWLKESEFSVKLGGNTYINTPDLISYQGNSMFRLYRDESGNLAIDFEVYNSSRQKIASVKKNNIYPHRDHTANLELNGTADTLTLSDRETGKAIVEVRKRTAATEELDVTVDTYLPNGYLLHLGPETTNVKGFHMTGAVFKDSNVGIAFG